MRDGTLLIRGDEACASIKGAGTERGRIARSARLFFFPAKKKIVLASSLREWDLPSLFIPRVVSLVYSRERDSQTRNNVRQRAELRSSRSTQRESLSI
jgi:hypothetical protein